MAFLARAGALLRRNLPRLETLVVGMVVALACACAIDAHAAQPCAAWPDWERFKQDFVSADGRVVDASQADARTVSEGQSYALFFALVANDRVAFDRILHWTENNLAAGDLTQHLPAWLWGRAEDGKWTVLDANSASDADLWIAYVLLEAGTLWQERSYAVRGTRLAARILTDETTTVSGFGRLLLPAPTGFHLSDGTWRVNPSYTPPQVVRALAVRFPAERRWKQLADNADGMLKDTAPRGFAPDWAVYRDGHGFGPDSGSRGSIGSYNAIRVYLWAGMLDPGDPLGGTVQRTFRPFADHIAAYGAPPEEVDTMTGVGGANAGNAGFSAAALPLLSALGEHALAQGQADRVAQLNSKEAPGYYTSVLSLFGMGWHNGRYRFAADGTLRPAWSIAGSTTGSIAGSTTCTPQ